MSFIEGHIFSCESTAHIARIIDNINTGIWEYNTITKKTIWSNGFYKVLDYIPAEIECAYDYFLNSLLHHDDKQTFLNTLEEAADKATAVTANIRVLSKEHGYQWFESTTQNFNTANGKVICGALTNINTYKKNEFKCAELGRIAKIGGWEIDTRTMKLGLSKEVYNIFELGEHVQLTIKEAIAFFEPQHRPVLTKAIKMAISKCKPYDLEVLFKTAKNNTIWVRAKGDPIFDEHGKCTIIRGIFQDIDSIKKKDLSMQSSLDLLDDQNKRLQNFAYIVSHNLRSHAGNLRHMLNMFEDAKPAQDRNEIFQNIKTISESLNATMGHLDEIVRVQSEITREKKVVNFETIFNNVTSALKANIIAADAAITTDFSRCQEIDYIPAYLESIVQNLLTNAIKYKHPNRKPVISCYTKKTGEGVYLIFEDNGLGIDMERYGDQLFGMYKTFHQNYDSKGIGLFITRNQVEALGGTIEAESRVNVGTTFTLKLT